MIGGEMVTSTRFLRISKFVILALLIGCGHSREELNYVKEIQREFPSYSFSLTDPVVGLELTVDIKTNEIDSSRLIQLFKDLRKPIKNYSTVSWVYLIVVNGKNPLVILRENPGGDIVFIEDRDK